MTLQDAKLKQILRRHDHKRADGVESIGTQHLVVLLALQGQMQVLVRSGPTAVAAGSNPANYDRCDPGSIMEKKMGA